MIAFNPMVNFLQKYGLFVCFTMAAGFSGAAQTTSDKPAYVRLFGLEEGRFSADAPVAEAVQLFPGQVFFLGRKKSENMPAQGFGWQVIRDLQEGYCILSISSAEAAVETLPAAFAQIIPANNTWKLAPSVAGVLARQNPGEERHLLVQSSDPESFLIHLQQMGLGNRILREFPAYRSFLLRLSSEEVREYILPSPLVLFIDIRPLVPSTELAVPNFDLSVNRVNLVHARYPELDGRGLTVSVKEYRPDSTDIDFRDRYISSGIGAPATATHSTTMATIIAGGGNSFYTGKGVAWAARLSSASFFNLFPEDPSYYQSASISVQNHSYGLGIENYYGAEAQAYDEQVHRNPAFVHVFSSGNIGDRPSEEGPYAGISGYANLTGTFKMAKNLLTVGAVDSFFRVESRSSRGPAFDGRIKPELVAFGQDGSSGAAAITSGLALLMQQAYREQHGDTLPPAALVRAVLLNSADDLGPEGPDYSSGFGNVNAGKAIEGIKKNQLLRGQLPPGESFGFELEVPAGAAHLKITLAWTDPPALVNSSKTLVNDLDLTLAGGNNTWLPWVLNPFPHADSLALPARRGTDRLNNQEQISLRSPAPGKYQISVQAYQLREGNQEFFLAYSWDTEGGFQWTFPTATDNAHAGRTMPVRWESTLPGTGEAKLAYSFTGNNEWIPVSNAVDLTGTFLNWKVPDTTALAILRMSTPAGDFLSDTFPISKPMVPKLGLDCSDSLLWYWPSVEGISTYQLFTFVSDTLTPTLQTSDTVILLKKSTYPSAYFAVAPIIQPELTGIRSPTLRTDFQNAGCYIRSFLADPIGGQARLRLELGTLYQVEEIFFEKKEAGQFIPLATFPVSGMTARYDDRDLQEGFTSYRAGVRLTGGRKIYSDEDAVLFVPAGRYILFPNPVEENQDIAILSLQPNNDQFHLFDALGRLVLREELLSDIHPISTGQLEKGIYFYLIERAGKKRQSGKILVR